MNNNWTPLILFTILSTICIISSIICCKPTATSGKVITTSNTTRDYQYEHYCDSIYDTNPDYYHDVLVETDSFQNYIEEHGEWWNN